METIDQTSDARSSVLDESTRLAYIAELGIDSWMPRHVLPNAKQSEECIYLYPEYEELKADSASVDETISDVDAAISKVETVAVSSENTKESPSTVISKEVDRFIFSIHRYAGECLVINEMPVDGANVLSNNHQQLLNNIITACQLISPSDGVEQHATVFNWPLVTNRKVDCSRIAGSEAIQAHVVAQCAKQPVKQIILMGRSVASYLIDDVGEFDSIQGKNIKFKNVPVITTLSLNELLTVPGAKREVWSDLQCIIP